MPAVTSKELERSVKSGEIANAYYLYGTDFFSVSKYKKAIVDKVVRKGDETYNLHTFQGKDFDAEGFAEACEALPMFAERLCVTVCDLDLDKERLGAAKEELIIDTVKNLPDTTVVIFFTSNIDICDGKKYPTAKNKKLADAVSKIGTVCELKTRTRSDIIKDIKAKAAGEGCTVDDKGAALLCDRCLSDYLMILNETDKLTAYVGKGGHIDEETVRLITPDNLDAKGYNLSDAVAAGDMSRAMAVYNELADMKVDPVYMLYILAGSMNDLYRARLAIDSGKSISEAAADFGYAKNIEFRLKNAFSSARKTPVSRLRYCMEILAQTDVMFKTNSGAEAKSVLLEEAIVKMLSNGV
ncbi:MAG: DNA polymerase III subunit delta [Huintestinicola sp.]